MNVLIIHHDDLDGRVGAFCLGQSYERYDDNVTYHAIQYGMPFPEDKLVGINRVVVVDFSFAPEVFEGMVRPPIYQYDHHLKPIKLWEGKTVDGVTNVFDTSKSGALLGYDISRESLPYDPDLEYVVNYANDYDLWKFKQQNSKAITRVMNAVIQRPADVQAFMALDEEAVVLIGQCLRAGAEAETLKNYQRATRGTFHGQKAVFYNGYDNEMGDLASADGLLLVMWRVIEGKFVFSLRGEGAYEIATTYPGGGGHKQAAGFTVPFIVGMSILCAMDQA